MVDLPPHEQESALADLPVVKRWIERNPNARATAVVAEDPFNPGESHTVLIVSIREPAEMGRAQSEIPQLVKSPEHLRVRRWKPSADEVERIQQWVMTTQPQPGGDQAGVSAVGQDPETGLVTITLDRVDGQYAAELEAATDGLAVVLPDPEIPVAPVEFDPPRPPWAKDIPE
ncbi:MAG: hypothetical protein QOH50_3329 [Kribbellaceae bacterium]|jgi:hypothetical protein|nr:hypothetical protein [Kribbellaceae bacterium]